MPKSFGKFAIRDKQAEANKRRKSVQDTLKDIEQRQKLRDKNIKSPPLKMLIQQAGMRVSPSRFYLYSAIAGLVVAVLGLFFGSPLYLLPRAFHCRNSGLATLVCLFSSRPADQGILA